MDSGRASRRLSASDSCCNEHNPPKFSGRAFSLLPCSSASEFESVKLTAWVLVEGISQRKTTSSKKCWEVLQDQEVKECLPESKGLVRMKVESEHQVAIAIDSHVQPKLSIPSGFQYLWCISIFCYGTIIHLFNPVNMIQI
jgi:hypothetical protein